MFPHIVGMLFFATAMVAKFLVKDTAAFWAMLTCAMVWSAAGWVCNEVRRQRC